MQRLPEGAQRSLVDPYAPKRSRWPKVILALLLLGAIAWGLYRFNVLHRWFPDYVPAWVKAGFDGPAAGFAGGDPVVVEVGSGASSVDVRFLDGTPSLPVVDGKVTVPMAAAKEGAWILLIDASAGREPATHSIAVRKKP
jgi:hypothetical protein